MPGSSSPCCWDSSSSASCCNSSSSSTLCSDFSSSSPPCCLSSSACYSDSSSSARGKTSVIGSFPARICEPASSSGVMDFGNWNTEFLAVSFQLLNDVLQPFQLQPGLLVHFEMIITHATYLGTFFFQEFFCSLSSCNTALHSCTWLIGAARSWTVRFPWKFASRLNNSWESEFANSTEIRYRNWVE